MTRTITRITSSAGRLARTAAIALCALALFAPSSRAATILVDNFESYADTAALNAAWPVGAGNDTVTFLDAGPAGSTNTSKTVHTTNRQGRRDRTFTPTLPTAAEPLVVSYDLYDAGGDNSANEYNQILAFDPANALTQLISMGKSTNVDMGETANPNKYQARVAFPPHASGGVNWFPLNANRSIGWHTFTAEIFPTTVNFYVDGILDTANVSRAGGVGNAFSTIRLGSGLSSRAEVGYYDNVGITTGVVPEPGTVTMLSLGGLIGAAAAWRKQRARKS
jgi:hypothetical protein